LYANRALDAREPLKAHLRQAGLLIGEQQMRIGIAVEYSLTIALTFGVAWAVHSFWLLVVVSLCILGDAAYNLEPFRLKRRGVGNPVVIFFRCGVLPGLIPWFALHPVLATPMLLSCLGMGLFFTGRQLEHAIPDTANDRLTGVSTPAVLYGARPVLGAVVLLVLAAISPLFLGFSGFVGSLWAGIGTAGIAVTLVGALRLLATAGDEQDILTLLHTVEADSHWRRISAAIYILFLVPGVIHVLSLL
jgi:4-hydroxybenzoate polyprenyltransferase